LALREIERIEGEMTLIAKKRGLFRTSPLSAASLKTNSKYKPTSAEQILEDFSGHYIAQMETETAGSCFTLAS